jgi:hypothetical protein
MPRTKTFQPNLEKFLHRGAPAWRVRRATELFQSCIGHDGRLVRRQISKWTEGSAVYRYVQYLKAKRFGYVQERKQAAIMQLYIDIDLAKEIERQASPQRLELRLRILAGESSQRISMKMGLDERVVRSYCCYFFDVYDQKHSYLVNLPRPGAKNTEANHLEYFCFRFVDAYGPVVIDRLVDMFRHFGAKHDLATAEGRKREAMEIRFASYMLPRPTTIDQIGSHDLFCEHLRQSSSFLDTTYNSVFRNSMLDQLLKNTVPTPVIQADFDKISSRKSPRAGKEAVRA